MRVLFFLMCWFCEMVPATNNTDRISNSISPDKVFYELETKGNPLDPLNWKIVEPHNCPGSEKISTIAIFDEDIYTLLEAVTAGVPAWQGKPKVNRTATGIINEMAVAAVSPLDPYLASSGRAYYKGSN